MTPLQLVHLTALMQRTSGSPTVRIGLIDGHVAAGHPDLTSERLIGIPGTNGAHCTNTHSAGCLHATFIAGILSARRNSSAPAICPDCTLLIRPIFSEPGPGRDPIHRASPTALAGAIMDCIDAGARVINLSLAMTPSSTQGEQALQEVLDVALRRGVIVVAAAGNQGTLGSSAITGHPWVIPVVACDLQGRTMRETNLGRSIGSRGLSAPGDSITSLGAEGEPRTLSGTSVAVPFVSGAIALLWSAFPATTAAQVKLAVSQASATRRTTVVPPLLNAEKAYQTLLTAEGRR